MAQWGHAYDDIWTTLIIYMLVDVIKLGYELRGGAFSG